MSLTNFIPTIWSARLLENLRKSLVYAQAGVINRDYEGEIRDVGDSVRINAIGAVTISNYSKDTDINAPQTLQDAQTVLTIDQAKYFNFAIDDIDRAQQRPQVMAAAVAEAAYALRDAADQYVAGLHAGVAAGNTIGDDATPEAPTATTMYEYLVDLGVILDDARVPRAGRWVVVPPWCHGLLQKDDRFVKAGTARTDEVLRNGRVLLRPPDQPVPPPLFRAYAGFGLVIHCLARCQRTPSRRSVARTVSPLTRCGVRPCSKLTFAARSSVQTPPSVRPG